LRTILFIILILVSVTFGQVGKSISVELLDKDKLERIISDRNDKILLINIWATWCIPCREEFPELVRLSESYKNNLDIFAISVDFEDELNSKVLPFLESVNVNFPVYISNFNKDEELIKFFNLDWNGALPATFIYNARGKQIQNLEGKQSYESFSSILDKFK
jgi:thiol-disulfide isomerase/thioredoxin